jgi:hypothetical protein
MKILKYKHFTMNEELINTDIPDVPTEEILKQIQDNIDKIKQVEGTMDEMDQEDFDEMLEALSEQPMPDIVKRYMINSMKVIYDKEIREDYLYVLITFKKKLLSGMTAVEVSEDEEFKKMASDLTNLMARKLNLSREELDALTGKFIAGAKKLAKIKSDASRTSSEDPYGEEEWDDTTEEEKMRKAFEEE